MISSFFLINKVSAATSYNIEQKTTEDNITYYHPTGYEDVYLFKGEGKYVLIYGNSSSSISVASNGKLTDDNSNNVLYISFSSEQEAYIFIFNNTAGAAVFEVYNACYVYQNITYSKIFTNNFDNNSGGDSSIISKTIKEYYESDIVSANSHSTITEYNFEDFSLTYNGVNYNKEIIYSMVDTYLAENTEYSMSDYSYIFVGIPTQPTTTASSTLGYIYIDLYSEDFINTTILTAPKTAWSSWVSNYQPNNKIHLSISFSDTSMSYGFYSNSYITSMCSGNSTSKTMSVYTNFNISSSMLVNNSNYPDYMKIYIDDSMLENKSYEFNEDIDVTDISKIKINFELPEDTSNLEVDINWTFDNYTSGGNGYITTPYLEFKHSNGDITLSQDINNLNGGDWFSDDYIATLLPDSDITEISLIVDTVKASGLLKANFSSKFPYSISYEYTEEIEDYFITIDMDDYASISLIPKVYNLENGISSSISSPIYKYGIYDVEIWEDLETKKVIDRWDNHSTSQFIYPMYSGYKNCVIHFIKKEVDASERYIKFDSRYYSYVVKKYLNEEVTITNPNTNEDVIISDISDLYKYDSPVDKRFSFNSFLKPIKFVFESITDFYNNYCPEVVQYFFYLIFAFFVILVLIKIFL